jgi:transcription antitermination factor NusG
MADVSSNQVQLGEGTPSQWFAVYTAARHEKRIAQYFREREIQHFLPLYQVARKWKNGLRVTVELPLFPNYIFACIDRCGRGRVVSVSGVLAIVGGHSPVPLPASEIEALRAGVNSRRLEPHPYLVAGQTVRIKSGCLAGLRGVLLPGNNRTRAVITIEQIMRSVAVEVETDEVELLSGDCSLPSHFNPQPDPTHRAHDVHLAMG